MVKTSFAALIVIAGAIVVGGGLFVAVSWWRRYFRRLFEARLQRQEDGSCLAYWTRRGQPTEVHRIDALTKEHVLACLIDGSVASTGLFVMLIIGVVAINILAPTWLMIPGALLLVIVAFLPQRRAGRRAERLILAGTRVDGGETVHPPVPPLEVTVRSLRLIVLLSCLIAVMGIAIGVIFFLDPDSGTIEWTDAKSLGLVLLLVMLPLSVALFNWRVLRRIRA